MTHLLLNPTFYWRHFLKLWLWIFFQWLPEIRHQNMLGARGHQLVVHVPLPDSLEDERDSLLVSNESKTSGSYDGDRDSGLGSNGSVSLDGYLNSPLTSKVLTSLDRNQDSGLGSNGVVSLEENRKSIDRELAVRDGNRDSGLESNGLASIDGTHGDSRSPTGVSMKIEESSEKVKSQQEKNQPENYEYVLNLNWIWCDFYSYKIDLLRVDWRPGRPTLR